MKNSIRLILVLILCLLLTEIVKSDNIVTLDDKENDVIIILTGLDINDQTLELKWKIKNDSSHDVWICDSKDTNPAFLDYEVFLAKDQQTLVIRKRFDLPAALHLEVPFPIGRYVRLHMGEELVQSLSLRMPASPNWSFEAETGMAEYARRLVLEIGFYNEDLRGLILQIVDVANKFQCADPLISPLDIDDIEVRDRYFAGLIIAHTFNSNNWKYFKESVESEGDEILMPHMGQAFNAEQVLRITLGEVFIPYSKWTPLTSKELKSTRNQQSRKTSSSSEGKPNNKVASDSNGTDNSNNTGKG